MSDIETELARLKASNARIKKNIANAYSSIEEKGGEVPTEQNSANLTATIATVPGANAYAGSFDKEGLKYLGYDDETIEWYNAFCPWSKNLSEKMKLTSEDKEYKSVAAYTDAQNARYLPLLDITIANNFKFSSYKMTTIPKLEFPDMTDMTRLFSSCLYLITISEIDTSKATNMSYMFQNCTSLLTVPKIKVASTAEYMFLGCTALFSVEIDTSNLSDAAYMFQACRSLIKVPNIDMSNITNARNMFSNCSGLEYIGDLDTPKLRNAEQMFASCYNLKHIGSIDTSKVTNISQIFYGATCDIPELDCSSVTSIQGYIIGDLVNFGGCKDLGKSFPTTTEANTYYWFLHNSSSLSHDSLMNIINGLYDIKTKGCNTQQITLGSTLTAKLTADEIAIITDKGWTLMS